MNAPAISPRLQDQLAIFDSAGVVLTPAEIIWLAELRRPCDHPADGSVPWVMGAPLQYAGATWYPQHRLAETWCWRAFKLLEGDAFDQILPFLFSHIYSAPGDTFLRSLMGAEEIADTLRMWWHGMPLHEGQLDALCDRLHVLDGDAVAVPDSDKKQEDEQPTQDASATFAAMMCKAFPGVSPDYWLTEISSRDAMAMMDGVSGEGFATSESRTEAIANYLKAVKWIWRAHADG